MPQMRHGHKGTPRSCYLRRVALLTLVEAVTRWNEYGFHFFAWYFMFFSMGRLERKHGIMKKVANSRYSSFAISLLFCVWAALIPCWRRNTSISLPYFGELPEMVGFAYRFVSASVGTAAFWILFYARKPHDRISKAVALLGRETLGIYAVHAFVLAAIVPYVFISPTAVSVLLIFVMTLMMSAMLAFLIRRMPLGHLLA